MNNKQVAAFFKEQLSVWKSAAENYHTLNLIEKKKMQIDDFQAIIQYNPNRISSATAKIDVASIQKRPCFLCEKNRPAEQTELELDNDFVLLVNPYPIFNPHFTIAHKKHIPQQIFPYLDNLLRFSEQFDGYTFFYNGPTCGASAPDHLHFQACLKNSLPVETSWQNLPEKAFHFCANDIHYFSDDFYSLVMIISQSKEEVVRLFEKINSYITENKFDKVDYNLLSFYRQGKYHLFIYPRKQHRPSQYYAEGEKQFLISPGAVDMAGIFVLARREDFDKIAPADIKDIYRQVSLFL